MDNEYDDLESMFGKDNFRDIVDIEIEPEPNFQEEFVQTGEINYPGSEAEHIVEYEEDDVKAILALAEKNYQEYVKNLPNFRDLEAFLRTLPPEMASDIRDYAKENHIYGNQPLEIGLINQYGVIIQVRSFNKMGREFDKNLGDIVLKHMYVFDSGIDRKIKEFKDAENRAVKALDRNTKKIIDNEKARDKEMTDLHESMKEVINADKDNMLLKLRNDLIEPMKKDIKGIKDDIYKEALKAFKEVEKNRTDNNSNWLLIKVAVSSFIGSTIGGFLLLKIVGLLH